MVNQEVCLEKAVPEDFKVTDEHRTYCIERWGHGSLADILAKQFRKNWRDRLDDERPPKWKSAHRAFLRWMRETAPGGEYYRPDKWEEHLRDAKRMEGLDRKRVHRYDPRESDPPATRSGSELAQSMLAKIRGQLT